MPKEKIDLYTLDGSALLAQLSLKKELVLLDADLFRSISEYRISALLYQIRQELKNWDEEKPELNKTLFFVDFGDFFRWRNEEHSHQFEELMRNGFLADWVAENKTAYTGIRYVPFEKSQSQAKDCVISFIREDLFLPVRKRLDLNICFGDTAFEEAEDILFHPAHGYETEMPALSKLYAYRGLYLTEASRLEGEEIENLLSPERIIILPDQSDAFRDHPEREQQNPENVRARQMRVYSKKTETSYPSNREANLDAAPDIAGSADGGADIMKIDEEAIRINSLFDGVGMISPRSALAFNRALDPERVAAKNLQTVDGATLRDNGLAVSFQFRMPFCKGMLHTVDFHRFLKDEIIKKRLEKQNPGLKKTELERLAAEEYENLEIEDVFGIKRRIAKAEIILNQSLFKICGLLKKRIYWKPEGSSEEEREAMRRRNEAFLVHYFSKIREYGHSIYIAKTDRQLRYSGYANMTYQILNTLKLEQGEFDFLVDRHLERAGKYQPASILQGQWVAGSQDEENQDPEPDRIHKYLKANPLLALDDHVQSLIDSCRRQKIDALYKGKLEVEGDMVFLCRDLMLWLSRIAVDCGVAYRDAARECIGRGKIYVPGLISLKTHGRSQNPRNVQAGQKCAVFRSPHLSPNENVLAEMYAPDKLHRSYLGHLRRVAFLGAKSHMHSALGGADFDGDMVVVALQKEIVEACSRNCYREDGEKSLELINIPSLTPDSSTDRMEGRYVDAETVKNTFSNNIGKISNAAMKLCAAEQVMDRLYGTEHVSVELPYSSKYAAILNGTEIDAAKAGIRPDLRGAMAFIQYPKKRVEASVLEAFGEDPDWEQAERKAKETAELVDGAMRQIADYLSIKDDLDDTTLARVTVSLGKDEKDDMMPVYKAAISYHMDEAEETGENQEKTKEAKQKKKSETITCIQAEDVEGKPFIYQLLCRWAKARMEETAETANEDQKPAISNREKNAALKKTFGCTEKVSNDQKARIKEVIGSYNEVKRAVNYSNLSGKKDMRKSIRKRMLHLLRVKYDDIDAVVDGEHTIRQLADAAVSKLKQELKTSKELSQGLRQYFYRDVREEGWQDAWLFLPPQERKKLLDTLNLIPADAPENQLEGDILADFYCRGYNLMYFVFREALMKAKETESSAALNQVMEDPFHDELLSRARDMLKQGYTTSRINNRELVNMCRKELISRLQLEREDVSGLIRMLYAALDSKHREIIWRMFTWEEIKACVEVKQDA